MPRVAWRHASVHFDCECAQPSVACTPKRRLVCSYYARGGRGKVVPMMTLTNTTKNMLTQGPSRSKTMEIQCAFVTSGW